MILAVAVVRGIRNDFSRKVRLIFYLLLLLSRCFLWQLIVVGNQKEIKNRLYITNASLNACSQPPVFNRLCARMSALIAFRFQLWSAKNVAISLTNHDHIGLMAAIKEDGTSFGGTRELCTFCSGNCYWINGRQFTIQRTSPLNALLAFRLASLCLHSALLYYSSTFLPFASRHICAYTRMHLCVFW